MISKRFLPVACLSVLAVFACAQANADSSTPEEMILGTTSPDLLLMRGDVRDDLHLTTDQSVKILTIQSTFKDQTAKLTPPDTTDDTAKSSTDDSFDALRRYTIEQVDQVLTADQMKRLKQIALQLTGYSALERPEVQKQIELPKDIQIKIFDLANEEHRANESVLDKFDSGDLAPEQLPEIIRKNHQALNQQIAKILPDSIKEKFKALGGRTFKPTTTL